MNGDIFILLKGILKKIIRPRFRGLGRNLRELHLRAFYLSYIDKTFQICDDTYRETFDKISNQYLKYLGGKGVFSNFSLRAWSLGVALIFLSKILHTPSWCQGEKTVKIWWTYLYYFWSYWPYNFGIFGRGGPGTHGWGQNFFFWKFTQMFLNTLLTDLESLTKIELFNSEI